MAEPSAPASQPAAAASQQSDPEPKGGETPTYTVEEHRAGARSWYGCSPHAVAGALAGERKKNFTRDEVKAAVKDFLKRKDTTDRGDDK